MGILSGHTEEPVNLVNGPHIAEERGIELTETRDAHLGGLHRAGRRPPPYRRASRSRSPAPASGRATSRTWRGVWGEDFYLPFADHLAIFRYTDQPGMIGRVGTIFGEEGVNIVSAAVGAEPEGDTAVMALTTDAPGQPERPSIASSSSTGSSSGARSLCRVRAR